MHAQIAAFFRDYDESLQNRLIDRLASLETDPIK
jgi:hypothetical protein